MGKCSIKLIQLPDLSFPGDFRSEQPAVTNFSMLSDFNFLRCGFSGKTSITSSVSYSCFIQLEPGGGVNPVLPILHNLFYPEIIYNNDPENIRWSLKYRNKEIGSGCVICGHPFEFDWNLLNGTTGTGNSLTTENFPRNAALENDLKCQLEELGKHFFVIELDASRLLPGRQEYELAFEFAAFRPQKSVADIQLLFNVVPAAEIVRSYEFFDGIKKGFNLKTLSKVKQPEFLGITYVYLEEDETNIKTDLPDGDFEEVLPEKSYYKLLKPVSNLELEINKNSVERSTAYISYLMDTTAIDRNSKEVFYEGNTIGFKWIPFELEGRQRVSASLLSSRYDFYYAAREFFSNKMISNVTVDHRRDFDRHSIWTGTIEVVVETNSEAPINYSQWAHFISICKNRCLYKDIEMCFNIIQHKHQHQPSN